MSKEKDLLNKIHETRAAVYKRFKNKWDASEENAEFYRMNQFSDEQINKFTGQNRVPYVFDFITSPINTFIGLQRDTRRDITYLPFEKNDELKVELTNMIKDSILRDNNFLYLESDIFQDGLIEKTGVIGYEWSDEANPLGALKMYRVPQRQMVWDLNNRESDLNLCSWVSRSRLYSKKSLINKYPEYKKQIGELNLQTTELGLDPSYMQTLYNSDLDSVALVEFYERIYLMKYHIINVTTGDVLDEIFLKEKDAKAKIKDFLMRYEQEIVPEYSRLGHVPPPPPQLIIKPKSYPSIHKTESSLDLIFEDTDIDCPFYPYDKYHPFFHDGEYWSMIDLLKDPQKFTNRTLSMVDHQILTSSKGLLLISDKVPKKMQKDIVEKWNKTGGVATDIPDPDINIKFIPPTSFDPRLLEMVNFAISNIDRKIGGLNFQGLRETSNESGILFNQRVNQGSLSSFLMYDNLSKFKKSVGEKILWYITNYMSASQKIRIEGEELTKMAQEQFPQWYEPSRKDNYGYLTVNTNEENTLEGLKADIIVEETKHSVTKNQTILQQLGALISSSPMLAETISPKMIVELFDAPASVKQQWLKDIESLMQAKAERDKAQSIKPPSLSASLSDITLLPPSAQVQLAALFNIQLDQPVSEDKEIAKVMIDKDNKEKDLEFKRQKHIDQMNMKAISNIMTNELEREKLNQGLKNNGKDSQ